MEFLCKKFERWFKQANIGKFWRESFLLFTHPDGEAAKLPDAEVRSTNASSKKLNGAKKTLSFFELRFSNFSMLILTIIGNFFAKKKLPTF